MLRIQFLIILTFIFLFKSIGQQKNHFEDINYINSDVGLSQNEVTSILQDKKGFIWVATRGGLNRYDGNNIKVFQNEIGNPNSLINNSIETLFEDSLGYIWIGTKSNGISRYNPEFNSFEGFEDLPSKENNIKNTRVISISEGIDNEIWIGTWLNGFYIFNPADQTSRHFLENLKISSIIKASDGKMWVASSNGIYIYSAQGALLEKLKIEDSSIQFNAILEDEKTGVFYFASWGKELLSYNPSKKEFKQYENSTPENKKNNAYYLYQDKDGFIWIGTWGAGVRRFNPKTSVFTSFDLSYEKDFGKELYKDVLCVFQDKWGILWFGTNGGGICKVNKNRNYFKEVNKSSLPNEPIWSLLKDRDHVLWAGIKGIDSLFYSKNGSRFSTIELPKSNDHNSNNRKKGVKILYTDLENNFWLTTNNSLYQVKKKQKQFNLKPIKVKNQETSNAVFLNKISAIYQTTDSIFWIGSQQEGLRKSVGKGTPNNQSFIRLLKNQRISSFLERRNGQFWIGSYNGLYLRKPASNDFIRYAKKQGDQKSLSSNIIICMYEDKEGNLWVGTPNGLNLVIQEKDGTLYFKSFQQKDGLPNSYINSILEDDYGNLWIATNKGVSKFNLKNQNFYNYDVNAGLKSNTFTEATAIKDNKGKFHFGGIYGLTVFHPDSIQSANIPEVILTGFKISGQDIKPLVKYNGRTILEKSIEYDQAITLTHSYKNFSIEYVALDFLENSGYSFKYKMEGLDKEWQTTSFPKNITYTNLKAGNYIFNVKATNNKSQDYSKATQLKIKILLPFWKTWQAFLVYTLLFSGLLYLYRYIITQRSELRNKLEISKLNRKKEEELISMKTQFFTDIAHEFRTPLSLISGPVQMMLEQEMPIRQQKNHLSTIYYHTQRLLNLVTQLLDFRKVESGKMKLKVAKGNFAKFAYEIFLSFNELADHKNIKFKFKPKNDEIPLTYDRQKMEIVLCNLLSNAFKHTTAKNKITFSIKIKSHKKQAEFPNGYCEIIVKDTGAGMNKKDLDQIFNRFYQIANSNSANLIGTGIGLALVKSIVNLHHGKVIVDSELGKGSAFKIRLPLGGDHFTKDQYIVNFKKSEDPIHYIVERVLPQNKELPEIFLNKNKSTLLVVEDNPEIRKFIKAVFEEEYTVIEAENGRIGIQKALDRIPDIIISDVVMPEMDGISFCKELRKTKKILHIPVVMLTARTNAVYQQEGYGSGADIYVTKPFNPLILKAQVESLISNRKKIKDYFEKRITLQPTETDELSFDETFLNNVIKVVEDNLENEALNRDYLASKMATSSSSLYRKIKTITGYNTSLFIRSIRLKKAAQMILNKQGNISTIAYAVGFNDIKYFRTCFKEQFGFTPTQYKKENIN